MAPTTEQERFWQGKFGAEYLRRNQGPQKLAANVALFAQMLQRTCGIQSVLEFGPNIGLNLQAIASLVPQAQLSAVEINPQAAQQLRANMPDVDLHVGSMLEFDSDRQWDFVFTKGVLIHLDPGVLPAVYDLLVARSSRYVAICEYYNPTPVEVPYRGHEGKLFKRDFAGELLDSHRNLQLVDYGFAYHRDPVFPQDDMTWFLFAKTDGASS